MTTHSRPLAAALVRITAGVALAAAALTARPAAAQQPDAADSTHQHSDTLLHAPIVLRSVTITSSPTSRDEPLGITHVTGTELRRTPAVDPYEALRQTAGLEVHDQGQGPGFASDASLRGFSSDHSTDIALWVDGVPNNEPVNGHAEGYNDWYVIFPGSIRDIDVLRGPTSALYGNFSLAGTVNVRTLERIRRTEGLLSGGSYGRVDGSLLTGVDRAHTGAVVGVRGLREDGWRPNSGYWLGQVHGRVVHDLSPAARLDAGVELYGSNWDSPGFLTADQFDARQFDVVSDPTDGGFKRRAQERVGLRIVAPNRPLLWRTTAYATQGRWQLFLTTPPEGGGSEGSGSQLEEEDHRYGFGLTSAVTYALDRVDLTTGIDTRWDHSHFESYFTTSRARDSSETLVRASQLAAAAFVQSTIDLGHHFRLAPGIRYDMVRTRSTPDNGGGAATDSHGIIAPKLGLLYHLPAGADVYGNLSRGFRQTDGVIEDPTLPFVTAWAYETGLKVNRGPVYASAALFRMDVSNEQTFDPVTLSSTSGGRSRRQGAELTLDARITPSLHALANWTFNDAKYRNFVSEEGDTLSGVRVFNTAKQVGSATLIFNAPSGRWDAQVGTSVVGPYAPFDEPGVLLPAYALLQAGAGFRIGATRIGFGVRNLTNHRYPELRAGAFVVPGQPRSIYGQVELH